MNGTSGASLNQQTAHSARSFGLPVKKEIVMRDRIVRSSLVLTKPESDPKSAARACLKKAAENRNNRDMVSAFAQEALQHLSELGVKEGMHLVLLNIGLTVEAWKEATGESFVASVAKRHFYAMEQKQKEGATFDRLVLGTMAQKYASAASVRSAADLEKVLGVSASRWERVTGKPFVPLAGKWRTIGWLVDPKGGPARPLRSFRLNKMIPTGPHCGIG